jgi:hypothetical protein
MLRRSPNPQILLKLNINHYCEMIGCGFSA